MPKDKFEDYVQKTYQFLSGCNIPYLVIGGLAGGILGDPRLTYDFDFMLFLSQEKMGLFLEKAASQGFVFDKERSLRDAKERLCFQMKLGSLAIDCLIATSLFEAEILKRCLKVKFGDIQIPVPSPEDFILLKLIVGRDKDLLDAKAVALRHRGNLDTGYLQKQAALLNLANKELLLERLKNLLKEILLG